MKREDLEQLRAKLTLSAVKPPKALKVQNIQLDFYVDSDGENALLATVHVSEDAHENDLLNLELVEELEDKIRAIVAEHEPGTFVFIRFRKPSELEVAQ